MILNLTDEQATDMLLEHDEHALRQHLSNLPELARKATENNDVFWRKQQGQICARVSSASNRRNWAGTFVWATAFTVLLIFCFQTDRGVRMNNGFRAGDMKQPVQPQSQNDPDRDLLVRIEREIGNDGPAALAPAALLAQEISQSSTPGLSNSGSTEREQ